MLPDWSPNVHPLIVHFPIALLVTAAFVDALALALRRRVPDLRHAATGLYALGAVGAIAALVSGRDAVDSVELPTAAIAAAAAHADWATWTAWTFGAYAAFRLVAARVRWDERLAVYLPVALAGAAALVLVFGTAERGARLVYDLGVGVRAVQAAPLVPGPDASAASADELVQVAGGGWSWKPGGDGLPPGMEVVAGDAGRIGVETAPQGAWLSSQAPVLLAVGEPFEGMEVSADLDLTGFEGTATLVHHVRGADDYDFVSVQKSGNELLIVQGRQSGGALTVFDRASVAAPAGPFTFRAAGYGTHFRGYVGGEMAVHGHGEAAAAGRAGLRIEGPGRVRLLRLAATPIADE